MKILVTGSAGHLGEALMRALRDSPDTVVGLDLKASAFTDHVGSITERGFVQHSMQGIDAVVHTATLHKPHIATHSRQDFVDTNISGTLNLLEAAVQAGVKSFIYTSTTSVFGHALVPPPGEPAAWITEEITPIPKNIYGVTKFAAENLCELFQQLHQLPCIVLRTSRFFPEDDDDRDARNAFVTDNLKVNELLYRRADLADIVSAHRLAISQAPLQRFGRYIISATTPFSRADLPLLRSDAPAVVKGLFPQYESLYARLGWSMLPSIDRIYANDRARQQLGWQPQYAFASALQRLHENQDYRSPLSQAVGSKGYL